MVRTQCMWPLTVVARVSAGLRWPPETGLVAYTAENIHKSVNGRQCQVPSSLQ
jgi:hypothetical protein